MLSALVVAACTYASWAIFQPQFVLPFGLRWVDTEHVLIEPYVGITPANLHPGDRFDLSEEPLATRIALVVNGNTELPAKASYPLVIERGRKQVTVTVHPFNVHPSHNRSWFTLSYVYLMAVIALLALWRGRDWAAYGMAFWAMAGAPFLVAISYTFPSSNGIALLVMLSAFISVMLARLGFYVMVESLSGSALSRRARRAWRALFALSLGLAALDPLGGRIAEVVAGWAGLIHPWLQWFVPASYLVPIALLVACQHYTDVHQRQRQRWLVWASALLLTQVVIQDDPITFLGFWFFRDADYILLGLIPMLFLYAVLRQRVINVTVAINRTMVYAVTMSLVLGLFALFESLIERSTVGHDAGLVLELAVPLALGVILSSVHRRVEAGVERYIFRRQYRAERILRRFSEECGFIRAPENLFRLGVSEIARQTEAPNVALYERGETGYVCRCQEGVPRLPESLPDDDPAFIRLRARHAELELKTVQSALGPEGYVYPLMQHGELLGALLVADRPGERYAADERALLFHVAHGIGGALFALRAQESAVRARERELQLQEAHAREAALLQALSLTTVGNSTSAR